MPEGPNCATWPHDMLPKVQSTLQHHDSYTANMTFQGKLHALLMRVYYRHMPTTYRCVYFTENRIQTGRPTVYIPTVPSMNLLKCVPTVPRGWGLIGVVIRKESLIV